MAYAAIRGAVPWTQAGPLMAANIGWVIAYDTFYAMADREDDLRIGVKSSAILFGRFDLAAIGILQIATLVLLWWLGRQAVLLWPYWIGLAVAALFAAQEQWMARKRERGACFAAFLHNVRFGAAIFAGIAANFLLN
jgi:4-hydroxybenzoate polyprenyltransferase